MTNPEKEHYLRVDFRTSTPLETISGAVDKSINDDPIAQLFLKPAKERIKERFVPIFAVIDYLYKGNWREVYCMEAMSKLESLARENGFRKFGEIDQGTSDIFTGIRRDLKQYDVNAPNRVKKIFTGTIIVLQTGLSFEQIRQHEHPLKPFRPVRETWKPPGSIGRRIR